MQEGSNIRKGIVIGLEGAYARVSTRKRGACEGCGQNGLCFGTGADDPDDLLVRNSISAQVGDTVTFGLPDGSMTRAGMIAYLLPLGGLIAGAMLGQSLSIADWTQDAKAMSGGAVGFAVSFGLAMLLDRLLKGSARYEARVLEVVPTGAESCRVRPGFGST